MSIETARFDYIMASKQRPNDYKGHQFIKVAPKMVLYRVKGQKSWKSGAPGPSPIAASVVRDAPQYPVDFLTLSWKRDNKNHGDQLQTGMSFVRIKDDGLDIVALLPLERQKAHELPPQRRERGAGFWDTVDEKGRWTFVSEADFLQKYFENTQ